MRTSTFARALVAVMALTTAPLHAQNVSGKEEHSSYRRPVGRVVVERRVPRVVFVERVRHRHAKHWRRRGYREVIVYYIDGRYYDRIGWGRSRAREVVVYERDGRYYRHD